MNNHYEQPGQLETEDDQVVLIELIDQHAALKELTVVRMARKDLENGNIKSAIFRLAVDLDKIRDICPELYRYVDERYWEYVKSEQIDSI